MRGRDASSPTQGIADSYVLLVFILKLKDFVYHDLW